MNSIMLALTPMAADLDLSGKWGTSWSAIKSALGDLTTVMTVVGFLFIVFTVGKYLWDRRRGGGGNSGVVIFGFLFGCLLISPEVLIPVVLSLFDLVINFGTDLWDNSVN